MVKRHEKETVTVDIKDVLYVHRSMLLLLQTPAFLFSLFLHFFVCFSCINLSQLPVSFHILYETAC